tara:strand:+ start:513 stop:812 length:300 start_codon:yes stop_codon:yes gene_type:complete
MIQEFLKSKKGRIFVSIVWGLGLAFLFRKACLNKNCVVIKGPNPKEVAKSTYKHEGRCYQYVPYITKCHKKNVEMDTAVIEETVSKSLKNIKNVDNVRK